jgi:hypothetical protein
MQFNTLLLTHFSDDLLPPFVDLKRIGPDAKLVRLVELSMHNVVADKFHIFEAADRLSHPPLVAGLLEQRLVGAGLPEGGFGGSCLHLNSIWTRG